MDWLQVFTIAGSTIGACYWMHRESKSENKQLADEFRCDSNRFREEMKEFHGRLCTIEERYLQMMQNHLKKRDGDLF
jgi:hypothetical protein